MSNNEHGATPAGQNSPQFGHQQFDQQGYPQGQPNQGYPQQGYPQQGHAYQQAPEPKKKNFFVRHKILTGLLALCVVGGIAAAAGGKKDDTSTSGSTGSSSQAAGSDKSAGAKSDEKSDALPAVGAPIKDGNLEFTVTKVERDVPSVGDQYVGEKAQGAFTLVYVSVENVGTETQTVMADGQKAYDSKGIGYEANSTASLYVKGNDTFFKEINPGNTLKGVFVFDAPKGTKLTKARLHESMFSNGVEGSL